MSKNTGVVAGWSIAGIDSQAATTPVIRYVSARSLNCRLEPMPTAGVSRGLKGGEQLSVGEEKDGWVRVNSSPPCWVMASCLSDAPVTGAESMLSATAPVAALWSSATDALIPEGWGLFIVRLAPVCWIDQQHRCPASHGIGEAKGQKTPQEKDEPEGPELRCWGCQCSAGRYASDHAAVTTASRAAAISDTASDGPSSLASPLRFNGPRPENHLPEIEVAPARRRDAVEPWDWRCAGVVRDQLFVA